MPRKAKTEETVVTEENILHENDMETENVPDTEETEMDGENPDTLSADADTEFSTAEESTETAVSAEPVSNDEVSTEAGPGITEPLQEESVSVDEPDSHDTIPASDGTDPVAKTENPSEASSSDGTASKPARKRAKASAIKKNGV